MVIYGLGLLTAAFIGFFPLQSWEFEFAGRSIKVKRAVLRHTVAVDGVVQSKTRVGGRRMSERNYEVVVSGRTLRIRVFNPKPQGYGSIEIVAWEGKNIVFSSEQKRLAAGPPAAQVETADARHQAALAMLDELARNSSSRVVDASRRIRGAFRSALLRVPLGSSEDEEEVEDLIETVRALHVASTRISADEAIDEVADVLDQLDADKEVSDLGRRRRASRVLKQGV